MPPRSIVRVAVIALLCGGLALLLLWSLQDEPDPGRETAGRSDGPPRRVVVANTSVLDTVARLIPAERVAAIPRQAFTWSGIARSPEGWDQLPQFSAFVVENVLAHDPDLVLCSPQSTPETVTTLRELGLTVVAVPMAADMDDLRRNLEMVAELLGVEDLAAIKLRELDQRIAGLGREARAARGLRALLYTWSGNEGWSAGSGTLADEMLQLCGLRNALAEAGHSGPVRLSIEQILGLDPDLLIVPQPYGEVVDRSGERLRGEPALAELEALNENRVIELHPSLFSSTSYEIVTAAEQVAAAVDALDFDGLDFDNRQEQDR